MLYIPAKELVRVDPSGAVIVTVLLAWSIFTVCPGGRKEAGEVSNFGVDCPMSANSESVLAVVVVPSGFVKVTVPSDMLALTLYPVGKKLLNPSISAGLSRKRAQIPRIAEVVSILQS